MLFFLTVAICGFIVIFSLLFGHHDLDHDHDMGHEAGASVFSSKVIALFVTGFGASGTVAAYYGQSMTVSSLIGLLFGLVLGAAGYFMVNFFYKQQADSLIKSSELVGQLGTLNIGIVSEGMGEVTLSFKGQKLYYPAKTKDGAGLQSGSTVRIVDNVAGTLIVEKAK